MVDYQNTPLGERMPGIEIHAQLLENLLDQTWLRRPRVGAARRARALRRCSASLLIWATPRWRPRNAAAARCRVHARCRWLRRFVGIRFCGGWLFDAPTPALGLLLLFSVLLLLTLGEATRQRRRLERVVQASAKQAALPRW